MRCSVVRPGASERHTAQPAAERALAQGARAAAVIPDERPAWAHQESWPARPRRDGSAARLNPGVAHLVRVHDYWLGGRDNFAADRQAGDELSAACPGLVTAVQGTRAFLGRAVRFLAAEAGVRQFLDIGAGLPTAGSTHQVAQSVAAEAVTVYADSDPAVFAHARALLASRPHGNTSYLAADLGDTADLLAAAASALDLARPVAIVLTGVLELLPDEADPPRIVAALLEPMPPGSFLVVAHAVHEPGGCASGEPVAADRLATGLAGQPAVGTDGQVTAGAAGTRAGATPGMTAPGAAGASAGLLPPVTARTPAVIRGFFTGLDLLFPGLVPVPNWRQDPADPVSPSAAWGGVGAK